MSKEKKTRQLCPYPQVYLHEKSGKHYVALQEVKSATNGEEDVTEVLYKSMATGMKFTREVEEFYDGRFTVCVSYSQMIQYALKLWDLFNNIFIDHVVYRYNQENDQQPISTEEKDMMKSPEYGTKPGSVDYRWWMSK